MTKDAGIRALVPGVVLPSEEKEKQEAREYIRRKLGVRNELQAAPITLLSDTLIPSINVKLPAETKDEYGFTPSQNKEIEKQLTQPKPPSGLWKNFVKHSKENNDPAVAAAKALIESNKLAEKESPKQTWNRLDVNEKKRQRDHVKRLEHFGIENSQTKHPDYPKVSNPPILRNNINKKEEIILDPKHPDGFRFAEDIDLYRNYGDTPVRYIQEIRYKYDGAAAPTDSVVKTFDGADSSTFPSNPDQKKALTKYQVVYDKLSPLQKKQLETTQKLKKK